MFDRKKYDKEYGPRYYQQHKAERYINKKRYRRTIKGRFAILKEKAKERGLQVSITLEQFKHLQSQVCFYCLGPLPAKTGYGLDRINNKLGYTIKNVRPCCRLCNQIRRAIPDKEFRDWIKRVSKNPAFSIRSL